MALEDLWRAAEALRRQLRAHTDPAAREAAAHAGLNGPGWRLLLRVCVAAPEPVSASRLGGWNPYVNPWTYEAGLQHLAALGLLASGLDNTYTLTPAGQSALGPILTAVDDRLRALVPLDAPSLERLAALVEQVVAGCLAAPEPPRKTRLRLEHAARSLRLSAEAPGQSLVQVDQALAELAAYRDDCHHAAWQTYMVSGPAWDALTALWRGMPGTLDAVHGQLAGRGWPRDAYARALQELVRQDWLAGPEPYTLSPQGRAVRERAEAQTNRDFLAPWRGIDASELRELLGTQMLIGDGISLG